MTNIFLETAFVLILATGLGVASRFLKLPSIIGYIIAGLLVGPFDLWELKSQETFSFLSEIGVAFLLFLVGLELSLRELRRVGKVALYTGLGQIFFTSSIGLLLLLILGFNLVTSIYLSLALTFSSTIIIVKLLSEINDTNALYGRIAIGFLLVQDLVAIIALIFLSSFQNGQNVDILAIILTLLKGLLLLYLTVFFSKKILPSVFNFLSSSSEILFLGAVSFCMLAASFSKYLGFSIEIGAFLAGLALAPSQQNWQIASRVRPLRDLFIIIFFIVLGSQMQLSDLDKLFLPAIALSLFILVGNPIIVLFIMGRLGFRKRTSFLASITVAQISEFSLILVALGSRLGHIESSVVTMTALIGIVTIAASSYLILNGKKVYSRLSGVLGFFEKEGALDLYQFQGRTDLENHVVLIGCRRMGYSLLQSFKKHKTPLAVLDFDPEVIENLALRGVNAYFGDASDPEVVGHLNIPKAKIVISSMERVEDNINLLKDIKVMNPKAVVVLTASDESEALVLYAQGADFVAIPKILGGEYLAEITEGKIPSKSDLRKLRQKEIEELQQRLLNKNV